MYWRGHQKRGSAMRLDTRISSARSVHNHRPTGAPIQASGTQHSPTASPKAQLFTSVQDQRQRQPARGNQAARARRAGFFFARVFQRRRVLGAALGTTAVVTGVLVTAGVAAAAIAGSGLGGSGRQQDPRQLVRTGMDKFRRNDVEGATADFDSAWELSPGLRPYLWQRGLAHYYLGRYEDGAQQFRSDVAVNPNDTEEAIWTFICEARTVGPEAARKQFLQVGRDRRPVMRAAYEAFQNGSGVDGIRAAISDDGSKFYGLLYVGLYYEAERGLDDPDAKAAILAACDTPYAKLSGDYMADLARVHCKRRGWSA